MRVKSFAARYVLVVAAFVFVLGLQAYLRIKTIVAKQSSGAKLSASDTCEAPATSEATAPKENPNKYLFISCGGFEE